MNRGAVFSGYGESLPVQIASTWPLIEQELVQSLSDESGYGLVSFVCHLLEEGGLFVRQLNLRSHHEALHVIMM